MNEKRLNTEKQGNRETGKRVVSPRFWVSLLLCIGFSILALSSVPVRARVMRQQSAPTLMPPTLVPTVPPSNVDALPSQSGLASIEQNGKVRVGILYNEPPFGLLNLRGEVSGFDADLARAMADTWGVTLELAQVTRQTAIDTLVSGQVDMLVAAQVHDRSLDSQVEFSETYYPGSEAMMVRDGDNAAHLADMANRKIGVVIGMRSEGAVASWQQRSGLTVTVQTYYTLDQAVSALANNEIDGVVDNRVRLTAAVQQPGVVRILDEPVEPEPLAVVVRRQDVNLRNLVNKTLQFLVDSGKMDEIHKAQFNGVSYPADRFVLWANVGTDKPQPSQFGADMPFPQQYVVPVLQSNHVLRVAGGNDLTADAPESQQRLDALNRALIEAIAARWGVQVQYIPNSFANAFDLVASGQADIAIGAQPDWSAVDRVDFSDPYLVHGDRLMVKGNSQAQSLGDLRGSIIAVFGDDPGAADRVNALASSVNTSVRIFTITREQDAAYTLLVDNNADAAFGDSLRLLPHVQANPDQLRLTVNDDGSPRWYSTQYAAFAVPRNDIDFRLLVDYTLQEMEQDGTLATFLQSVMQPQDIPVFDLWPGSSQYLGFTLARP